MKNLREKAVEIARLMEDGKGKDVVLLAGTFKRCKKLY